MEDRINAVVKRIGGSSLSDKEKVQLLAILAEALKASFWPAIVSRMPKDKLEEFTKEGGEPSMESYLALIEAATGDGAALDEAEATMGKLLDEVEKVLAEENI